MTVAVSLLIAYSMLEKIEGRRRRAGGEGQEKKRMRWLDGIIDTMDMGLGGLQYSCMENYMDRGVWWAIMGSQRVGHD